MYTYWGDSAAISIDADSIRVWDYESDANSVTQRVGAWLHEVIGAELSQINPQTACLVVRLSVPGQPTLEDPAAWAVNFSGDQMQTAYELHRYAIELARSNGVAEPVGLSPIIEPVSAVGHAVADSMTTHPPAAPAALTGAQQQAQAKAPDTISLGVPIIEHPNSSDRVADTTLGPADRSTTAGGVVHGGSPAVICRQESHESTVAERTTPDPNGQASAPADKGAIDEDQNASQEPAQVAAIAGESTTAQVVPAPSQAVGCSADQNQLDAASDNTAGGTLASPSTQHLDVAVHSPGLVSSFGWHNESAVPEMTSATPKNPAPTTAVTAMVIAVGTPSGQDAATALGGMALSGPIHAARQHEWGHEPQPIQELPDLTHDSAMQSRQEAASDTTQPAAPAAASYDVDSTAQAWQLGGFMRASERQSPRAANGGNDTADAAGRLIDAANAAQFTLPANPPSPSSAATMTGHEQRLTLTRQVTDLQAHTLTYAALDLETTGLDPDRDHIVEIGIVVFTGLGETLSEFSTLVRSPSNPRRSSMFHGIEDDDLVGAPTIHDVLPDVLAMLSPHVVLAHKADFDLEFLRVAAQRAGIAVPVLNTMCTLQAARGLLVANSYRLASLHRHATGVWSQDAHTALGDARMTRDLLRYMIFNAPTRLYVAGDLRPVASVTPRVPCRVMSRPLADSGSALYHMLAQMPGERLLPATGAAAQEYLALVTDYLQEGLYTRGSELAVARAAVAGGFTSDQLRHIHLEAWDATLGQQVTASRARWTQAFARRVDALARQLGIDQVALEVPGLRRYLTAAANTKYLSGWVAMMEHCMSPAGQQLRWIFQSHGGQLVSEAEPHLRLMVADELTDEVRQLAERYSVRVVTTHEATREIHDAIRYQALEDQRRRDDAAIVQERADRQRAFDEASGGLQWQDNIAQVA